MSYSKHAQLALVIFSREDLEAMAKYAAKAKLVGGMYIGNISDDLVVRWQDDGSLEVIIPHTPSSLKSVT